MLRAALAEGVTGRWVWDATVFHLVPVQRQSTTYVFTYYRAQGYLYAERSLIDTGGYARALLLARTVGQICRHGAIAFAGRILGRGNWVARYADCARWTGRLDRLRNREAT